jgi:uncharacterized protein with ParB-like and HNH nuclease domain
MKADSITLQKLFEQTIRYRIPLFQRPYVWSEAENWMPLWDDVRNLAERHLRNDKVQPHFLGAVVLDLVPGQVGDIEMRQVIDGQQRLTTLQVIFAVLRDLATEHGLKKFSEQYRKMTENDASFVDDADDVFKVWPTNRDRDAFRTVMTAGSPQAVREAFGVIGSKKRVDIRLADAYLYFHEELSTWLNRDSEGDAFEEALDASLEEQFAALGLVLYKRVYMVAMDLEENDDAQVIFETLNHLGAKLLPADLVKNYLFRRGELEQADIESLYQKYWQHFDDEFWRTEVRQGRLSRPRIDLFLQHYLTLKTYDEVNLGHIFNVFKQYAEHGAGARESVESLLKDLATYGSVYRRFQEPTIGARSALFFERLEAIDTATVYPFLLEVFRVHDTPKGQKTLGEILNVLESFLVRRMVCGLTNKSYNRLFIELAKDAEKAGGITPEGVRASLLRLNSESVRWPDDKEFREAFLNSPIYKTHKGSKIVMILLALEAAMENGKSEVIVVKKGLSIEHLIPRSWELHWKPLLKDPKDPIELQQATLARNAALHTFGNLTLVTEKLNPALSNSAWKKKRPEILRHSKLNLNRAFQDVEAWDEDAIAKRGKKLFRLACRIWPHPGGDADA